MENKPSAQTNSSVYLYCLSLFRSVVVDFLSPPFRSRLGRRVHFASSPQLKLTIVGIHTNSTTIKMCVYSSFICSACKISQLPSTIWNDSGLISPMCCIRLRSAFARWPIGRCETTFISRMRAGVSYKLNNKPKEHITIERNVFDSIVLFCFDSIRDRIWPFVRLSFYYVHLK